MKLSVVTVCYNAGAFVEGCLRSVATQTHHDIEHIIIDGQSTDGTLRTIQRYPHVACLVSEPDRGIYDAMNKGLSHVTGDYVIFLNADDRFVSEKAVALTVAAIERDSGADVYYGSLEVRSADQPPHIFHPPPPSEAPRFMICGCLPHQSTLARPDVFAKTGRFDLRYRYHADYDWFLKILADPTIDVRRLPETIGSFLLGGASSQLANGQPEVYAIQNNSPLYATPKWDRERICALQEAFLQERLEAARLRAMLRDAHEELRRLRIADKGEAAIALPASENRSVPSQERSTNGAGGRAFRLRLALRAMLLRWLPQPIIKLIRQVKADRRAKMFKP